MLPSQTRHRICRKEKGGAGKVACLLSACVKEEQPFKEHEVAGGALYMTGGGLPEKRGQPQLHRPLLYCI